MSKKMTGRIVTAHFVRDDADTYDCGLENCECPDHEDASMPPGTYITIRLDADYSVGLWNVTVEVPADD